MGNIRKKLVVLSLILISTLAIFYGCNSNVYKNLKLTLSEEYKEVVLSDNVQDNTFTISANVTGRPKGYNGAVSFSVPTNNSLDFVQAYNVDNGKTTAVFHAKEPGLVNINVVTLEGNITKQVTVKVIKQISGINFTTNLIPIVKGVETDIAKFLTFTPSNTNQTGIKIELIKTTGNPDLIKVVINGSKILVPTNLDVNDFDIVVRSTIKENIIARANAKVVELLSVDKMHVMYDSNTPNDTSDDVELSLSKGKYILNLASNTPDLHEKNIYINFNNSDVVAENYIVSIDNLTTDGSLLDPNGQKKNVVQIDYMNNIFTVKGVGNGKDSIVFTISRADFPNHEPFKQQIMVDVVVQAYPNKINITDGTNNINNLTIYANYDNPTVLIGAPVKFNVLNEDGIMINQDIIVDLSSHKDKVFMYNRYKQLVPFGTPISSNETYYFNHTFVDTPSSLNLLVTSETYDKVVSAVPVSIITEGINITTIDGLKEGSLSIDLKSSEETLINLGGIPSGFNYDNLTISFDSNLIEVIRTINSISVKPKTEVGTANLIISTPNGSQVKFKIEVYESLDYENTYINIAGKNIAPQELMENNIQDIVVRNGITIVVGFTFNGKKYETLPSILSYAALPENTSIVRAQQGYKLVTQSIAGKSLVTIKLTGYNNDGEKSRIATYKFNIQVEVPLSSIGVNAKETTIYDLNTLSDIQKNDLGYYDILLNTQPSNASYNFNNISWWLDYNGEAIEFSKSNAQILDGVYTMSIRTSNLSIITLSTSIKDMTKATISCTLPYTLSNDNFSIIARISQTFFNENGIEIDATKEISVKFYVEKPIKVDYFVFDNIETKTINNAKNYFVTFDERDMAHDGTEFTMNNVKEIGFEVYPANAFYKDLAVVSKNNAIKAEINNATKKITITANNTFNVEGMGQRTTLEVYTKDSVNGVNQYSKYIIINIEILNGSESNPFQINNVDDLRKVNAALEAHYVLTNNINIGEWTPIGYNPNNVSTKFSAFNGNFSGKYVVKLSQSESATFQYSLSNLQITDSSLHSALDYYGLFAMLGTEAKVHDLILNNFLINVNIKRTANIYVGAIAGFSSGIIENVIVNDYSNVQNYNGTYYNSIDKAEIQKNGIYVTSKTATTDNSTYFVGGLVGFVNNSLINNKVADLALAGDINRGTTSIVKEVYGGNENYNQIINSKSNSQINININENGVNRNISFVGGLVGFNNRANIINTNVNTINYGVTDADVITAINSKYINSNLLINQNSAIGGLAGFNNGLISGYSVNASIFGSYLEQSDTAASNIGGVVGYNSGSVLNNTSTPKLRGNNNVAGLIGQSKNTIVKLGTILNVGDVFKNYEFVNGIKIKTNDVNGLDLNSLLEFNKIFEITLVNYASKLVNKTELGNYLNSIYGTINEAVLNEIATGTLQYNLEEVSVGESVSKNLYTNATQKTTYLKSGANFKNIYISVIGSTIAAAFDKEEVISIEEIAKALRTIGVNVVEGNKVEFLDSSDIVNEYNSAIIGYNNVAGLIGEYEGLIYTATDKNTNSVINVKPYIVNLNSMNLTQTAYLNSVNALSYNSVYNYFNNASIDNKYGTNLSGKRFFGNIVLSKPSTGTTNVAGGLIAKTNNAYIANNVANITMQGYGSVLGGLIGSANEITQIVNCSTIGQMVDNHVVAGISSAGTLVGDSSNVRITQILLAELQNNSGDNYFAPLIPYIMNMYELTKDNDNNLIFEEKYSNYNNIVSSYSYLSFNESLYGIDLAGNNTSKQQYRTVIGYSGNKLTFSSNPYEDNNFNKLTFDKKLILLGRVNEPTFNKYGIITDLIGNQENSFAKIPSQEDYDFRGSTGQDPLQKLDPTKAKAFETSYVITNLNSLPNGDDTFKYFGGRRVDSKDDNAPIEERGVYNLLSDKDDNNNGINDTDEKANDNTNLNLLGLRAFFKNYSWYSYEEINNKLPVLLSKNKVNGIDSNFNYQISLLSNIPPKEIKVSVNQNYVNSWISGLDNSASTIYFYQLGEENYIKNTNIINFGNNNAGLTSVQINTHTNNVTNLLLNKNTYNINDILNISSIPSFIGISNYNIKSSNTQVLSVEKTNLGKVNIVARGFGQVTLTITSAFNTDLKKEIVVNVVNAINNLQLNYYKNGVKTDVSNFDNLLIQKSTESNPQTIVLNANLKGNQPYDFSDKNKLNFSLNENTNSGIRYYYLYNQQVGDKSYPSIYWKKSAISQDVIDSIPFKINKKNFEIKSIDALSEYYVIYVDVPYGNTTDIVGLTENTNNPILAVPYVVSSDSNNNKFVNELINIDTTGNETPLQISNGTKNITIEGLAIPKNNGFVKYNADNTIDTSVDSDALYSAYISSYIKYVNFEVKNASYKVQKSVNSINFFVQSTPTFDIDVTTDDKLAILYLTYKDESNVERSIALSKVSSDGTTLIPALKNGILKIGNLTLTLKQINYANFAVSPNTQSYITYTFGLEVLDEDKLNVQEVFSRNFDFFIVKNGVDIITNSSGFITNNIVDIALSTTTLPVVLNPQSVVNISMKHYPKGETKVSGEGGSNTTIITNLSEEAYNNIIPGYSGILKINISPAFSSFDKIVLTSNQLNGNIVWFSQAIAQNTLDSNGQLVQNGAYETIIDNQDLSGSITLKKVSNKLPNGTQEFDGFLYVRTLVNSFVENSGVFVLTATAFKNNIAVQAKTLELEVQTTPSLSLSINGDKKAPIARGTTANFNAKLTGGLEGVIDFSSSYVYREVNGIERNLGGLNTLFSIDKTAKGYSINTNINLTSSNFIKVIGKITKTINGEVYTNQDTLILKVADFVIEEINVKNVLNGYFEGIFNQKYPLIIEISKATYNSSLANVVDPQIKLLEKQFSICGNGESSYIFKDDHDIKSFGVGYNTNKTYLVGKVAYKDFNNELVYSLQNIKYNSGDKLTATTKFAYTENGIVPILNATDAGNYTEFVVEKECNFTFNFRRVTDEDKPEPISTVEEFKNMVDGVDYILVNDLVLENWSPFPENLYINSLDGNGYVITIKSFKLDEKPATSDQMKDKNIGIFGKINSETIIKNLIIEVLANKNINKANEAADKTSIIGDLDINATAYKNINFGLLAGSNAGIITNVQIINDATKLKLQRELLIASNYPELPEYAPYFVNNKLDTRKFLDEYFIKYYCPNYNITIVQNDLGEDDYVFTLKESSSKRDLSIVKINTTVTTDAQNHYMGLLVGQNITDINTLGSATIGYITNSSVENITINGIGYVAGFVAKNNGKISSSYYKGANIINRAGESDASTSATGGFVVYNDGAKASIQYCYVEGRLGDGNNFRLSSDDDTSIVTGLDADKTGLNEQIKKSFAGFLYNKQSTIANSGYQALVGGLRAMNSAISTSTVASAFVYENNANVSNSYANILVKSSMQTSGFVYANKVDGKISSCYTLSSVVVNDMAASPFTGKNSQYEYNIVTPNSITDCHYLKLGSADTGDSQLEIDFADKFLDDGEPATNLGASQFSEYNTFQSYAFNTDFSTNSYDEVSRAVWFIPNIGTTGIYKDNFKSDNATFYPYLAHEGATDTNVNFYTYNKPNLVAANLKTQSIRVWAGNDNKTDNSYNFVSSPIGNNISNPILIKTAEEFNKNLNYESPVPTIERQFAIRFISDIAFNKTDLKANTYTMEYSGDLDGNGMNIDQLRLVSDTDFESPTTGKAIEYLGLFGKIVTEPIDAKNSRRGVVRNLNISVDEVRGSKVTYVGALAGAIENANVFNINISGTEIIQGRNIVGGLAGIITGNSEIINISSSLSAKSSYFKNANLFSPKNANLDKDKFGKFEIYNKDVVDGETKVKNAKTISYVGGIAGIFDVDKRPAEETNKLSLFNSKARSLTVNGDFTLVGEVVGGIFGLIGTTGTVSDLKLIVSDNANPSFVASRVAGGLVGENRGQVSRGYTSQDSETQKAIDNIYKSTAENAEAGKYKVINTGYSKLFAGNPHFIGGLVGLNNGGNIDNSYSKINVTNISSMYAGGIIGLNLGGEIQNVYTTGSVLGFRASGGLIGMQTSCPITISSSGSKSINEEIVNDTFIDRSSLTTTNLTFAENKLSVTVAANIWREEDLVSDRSILYNAGTAYLGTLFGSIKADKSTEVLDSDGKSYFNLSKIFSNLQTKDARTTSETIFFVQPFMNTKLGVVPTNLSKLMPEIGTINNIIDINSGNKKILNDYRYAEDSNIIKSYAGLSGITKIGENEKYNAYAYSRMQNIGSGRSINEIFKTDLIDNEAKVFGDSVAEWSDLVLSGEIIDGQKYIYNANGIFGRWNSEYWTGVIKSGSNVTTADVNTAFPYLEAKPVRSRVNVYTVKDLQSMKNYPKAEFILQNDIDLKGSNWEPVGTISSPFMGSLHSQQKSDGSYYNYRIWDSTAAPNSDYSTYTATGMYVGLFGVVDDVVLHHFTLDGIQINQKAGADEVASYSYLGSLFAYTSTGAKVSYINFKNINVSTQKAVTAGGIAGFANDSSINYCNFDNINLNVDDFGNISKLSNSDDSLKPTLYGFGGVVGILGSANSEESTLSNLKLNKINLNINKDKFDKTKFSNSIIGLNLGIGGLSGIINPNINNSQANISGINATNAKVNLGKNNAQFNFNDANEFLNEVNVGSLFGLMNNSKFAPSVIKVDSEDGSSNNYVLGNSVSGGSEVVVNITNCDRKLNVGGAIGAINGMTDVESVNNLTTNANVSLIFTNANSTNGLNNIGGIIGFANNADLSNLNRSGGEINYKLNNSGNTNSINSNVGGIIGSTGNSQIIANCISNGTINLNIKTENVEMLNNKVYLNVGGAFGSVDMAYADKAGKISKVISNTTEISYNIDKSKNILSNIGGFAGHILNGTISESLSNTNLNGYCTSQINISALVALVDLNNRNKLIEDAHNYVTIENCYSTGSIKETNRLSNIVEDSTNKLRSHAGLIVGCVNNATDINAKLTLKNNITISHYVYEYANTSNVETMYNNKTTKGGILGGFSTSKSDESSIISDYKILVASTDDYSQQSNILFVNNYYNHDFVPYSNGFGTGITTEDMLFNSSQTFKADNGIYSWDSNIWVVNNNSYPVLKWIDESKTFVNSSESLNGFEFNDSSNTTNALNPHILVLKDVKLSNGTPANIANSIADNEFNEIQKTGSFIKPTLSTDQTNYDNSNAIIYMVDGEGYVGSDVTNKTLYFKQNYNSSTKKYEYVGPASGTTIDTIKSSSIIYGLKFDNLSGSIAENYGIITNFTTSKNLVRKNSGVIFNGKANYTGTTIDGLIVENYQIIDNIIMEANVSGSDAALSSFINNNTLAGYVSNVAIKNTSATSTAGEMVIAKVNSNSIINSYVLTTKTTKIKFYASNGTVKLVENINSTLNSSVYTDSSKTETKSFELKDLTDGYATMLNIYDFTNNWVVIYGSSDKLSKFNYGFPMLQNELKKNWFDEKLLEEYYWANDDIKEDDFYNNESGYVKQYNGTVINGKSLFEISSADDLALIAKLTNYGYATIDYSFAEKTDQKVYKDNYSKSLDLQKYHSYISYDYNFGVLTKTIRRLFDFENKILTLNNVDEAVDTYYFYNKLWTPIGFGIDGVKDFTTTIGSETYLNNGEEITGLTGSKTTCAYSNMFKGKIDGVIYELNGISSIGVNKNVGLFGAINPVGTNSNSPFAKDILIKNSLFVSVANNGANTSAGALAGFAFVTGDTYLTNKVANEKSNVYANNIASGLIGTITFRNADLGGQSKAQIIRAYVNANINSASLGSSSGLAYVLNGSHSSRSGIIYAKEVYYVGGLSGKSSSSNNSLFTNNGNATQMGSVYAVGYYDEKTMTDKTKQVITEKNLRTTTLKGFDWATTWTHMSNKNNGFPIFATKVEYWINYAVEPTIINYSAKTATIETPEQLAWVAKQVSDGADGSNALKTSNGTFEGWTLKIGANIDLANRIWTPIGYKVEAKIVDGSTVDEIVRPFSGTFYLGYGDNGSGSNTAYSISNIITTGIYVPDATSKTKVKSLGNDTIGLFGYTYNANIYSLNLSSGLMFGISNVGSVVGYALDTAIENCSNGATSGTIDKESASVVVSGYKNVGGLIGNYELSKTTTQKLEFNDNINKANVDYFEQEDALGFVSENFGGIVGYIETNGNSINFNDNLNNVNITGINKVGGLIGSMSVTSKISINCSDNLNPDNIGDITGTTYVGGIVGYVTSSDSPITAVKNSGYIKATDNINGYAGGIAGYSNANISLAVNEGTVNGGYSAGIVAEVGNTDKIVINNVLNKGEIVGQETKAATIAIQKAGQTFNSSMFGLAVSTWKMNNLKPILGVAGISSNQAFESVFNTQVGLSSYIRSYAGINVKFEDAISQNGYWKYSSSSIDIDYTVTALDNGIAISKPNTQIINNKTYFAITNENEFNYINWQLRTNFVSSNNVNNNIYPLYINNLSLSSSFKTLAAYSAYPLNVDILGPNDKGSISISSSSGSARSILGYCYGKNSSNIKIENLKFSNPSTGNSTSQRISNSGLLISSGQYVSINNVSTLNNATYYSAGNFGVLANSIMNSSISNCSIGGSINNTTNGLIGGLVANATNTNISDCTNSATITMGEINGIAGGIVGEISGNSTINNCSNTATLKGNIVGGIAGKAMGSNNVNNLQIQKSVNNGSISCYNSDSNHNLGGIIGYAKTMTITSNCSNSGSIGNHNTYTGIYGGIIGKAESTNVNYAENSGNVFGRTAGGIVGLATYGSIYNSTSKNSSISGYDYIGGIVGYINGTSSNKATIGGCTHSEGSVVIGGDLFSSNAGGFVGYAIYTNVYDNSNYGAVTYSNYYYYNIDGDVGKTNFMTDDKIPKVNNTYTAGLSSDSSNYYYGYAVGKNDGSVSFSGNNNYTEKILCVFDEYTTYNRWYKVISLIYDEHWYTSTTYRRYSDGRFGTNTSWGYTLSSIPSTGGNKLQGSAHSVHSEDHYITGKGIGFIGGNNVSLITSATNTNSGWYTAYSAGESMVTITFVDGSNTETLKIKSGSVFPERTMIKSGYRFLGWYTSSSGGSLVSGAVSSNITVYAHWEEAASNKITFDSQGGSAVPIANVKDGEKLSKPSDPTKKVNGINVPFAGWYRYTYDEALKSYNTYDGEDKPSKFSDYFAGFEFTNFNETKFIYSDFTLYAHWRQAVVTYKNVDKNGNLITSPYKIDYINWGEKITSKPTDPTIADMRFIGWSTTDTSGEDGIYTAFNFNNAVITKDITLYAKFETSNIKVTFYDELGNIDTAHPNKTIIVGSTVDRPTPEPNKPGYDFNGWFTMSYKDYIDNGVSVNYNTFLFKFKNESGAMSVSVDTKLYSYFTKKSYNVNFVNQEGQSLNVVLGDERFAPIIVRYQDTVGNPGNPEIIGNNFAGWYSMTYEQYVANLSAGETPSLEGYNRFKFIFGGNPGADSIEENTNVYAYFTKKSTLVSYFTNSGDSLGSGYENIVTYFGNGVDRPAKPIDPADATNVFVGWYTMKKSDFESSPDMVGKVYDDFLFKFRGESGEHIVNMADITAGKIYLYGYWIPLIETMCSVDFLDGNNNPIAGYDSITIKYNNPVSKPANPVDPSGFNREFKGWFTITYKEFIDSSHVDKTYDDFIFKFKDEAGANLITYNLKLYAYWSSPVTINFVNQEGQAIIDIDNQVIEKGEYITKPADPQMENMQFMGWYTKPLNDIIGGEVYDDYKFNGFIDNLNKEEILANLTLYAYWVPVEP